MSMTTSELRQAFFQFFESKGHQQVPSCSLVPADDPTLLFTNAGMNQFKDVFTGKEVRDYSRAVSSQRCVRAGGKHNDLENVGYTARHHTFFEMLGNFSFGDYFKTEAIEFAWEFLTQVLKLPVDKLLVTIYHDDEEAYNIWHQRIGLPAEKIIRIATSDNFWSMGDTGPCGPCSEIFYDHGEHIWGGPPGSPEEDGDRFIEIWNLVFMQFERQADGELKSLPKPSIDTGMGLERISAILQSVHSNYEIDLFQALIDKAAQLLAITDRSNDSLKVIADHIRSCSFLVTDGVIPSNDGRGYVLRRIIRRAIRHGYKLGAQQPFFHQLVAELARLMGDAYPELSSKQAFIEKVLRIEEEQFAATIERGMQMLETAIAQLQGDTIPGDVVFKLYDTYGFPADLTNDIARERQLQIDDAGFEAAMAEQRQRAQQASKFTATMATDLPLSGNTVFTGYTEIQGQSTVSQVIVFNELVEAAVDGDAIIVVEDTPFYAESGGQVGDTGRIEAPYGCADVLDTKKQGDLILHHCRVVGRINCNDQVVLQVNSERREHIKKNHSATHLLHAALRHILGPNVAQKGSLVEPDKLRFDFSHLEALTAEEIKQVEHMVNAQILQNQPLHTELMALEQAKAAGALALFGEKYDDQVRVVSMGDFSTELCGGTHVSRTGDIGLFKILSEHGIASGVRRIEAVTGQSALQQWQQQAGLIQRLAAEFKTDSTGLMDKITQQKELIKAQEKSLQRLKDKLAAQLASQLLAEFVDVGGVPVLVAEVEDIEAKALRGLIDSIKTRQQDYVAVIAVATGTNVNLIAGVSGSLTGRIKAGELVKVAAAEVGGKGGGRPDLAQAGGNQPENLRLALNTVKNYIIKTIGTDF